MTLASGFEKCLEKCIKLLFILTDLIPINLILKFDLVCFNILNIYHQVDFDLTYTFTPNTKGQVFVSMVLHLLKQYRSKLNIILIKINTIHVFYIRARQTIMKFGVRVTDNA